MIVVNVDGYIRELPEDTAYVKFTSGSGTAGHVDVYDVDGDLIPPQPSLGLEHNLPQLSWIERLKMHLERT